MVPEELAERFKFKRVVYKEKVDNEVLNDNKKLVVEVEKRP